jgi:hypothetical protein
MQSHRKHQSADRPQDEERSRRDREPEEAPEDRPGEPGAEGGSRSPTRNKLPGMPARDDPTPVGDTDQHSTG